MTVLVELLASDDCVDALRLVERWLPLDCVPEMLEELALLEFGDVEVFRLEFVVVLGVVMVPELAAELGVVDCVPLLEELREPEPLTDPLSEPEPESVEPVELVPV